MMKPPCSPTPTQPNQPQSDPHHQVVKNNWYGFLSWMDKMEGVKMMDSNDYDGVSTYDLVRTR